MPEFAPRAKENIEKSTHPDIDPRTGELRDDIWQDVERRDFNRLATDPARWAAFYGAVAREQAQLPQHVQQSVAGRTYTGGRDMYENFQNYQADVRMMRQPIGSERDVTAADIEKMSLQEYDALFDEHGRPRPGVVYHPTGRDVNLKADVDPYSARELRRREQP